MTSTTYRTARLPLTVVVLAGLVVALAIPGSAQESQQRSEWSDGTDEGVPDEADLTAVGLRFVEGAHSWDSLVLDASFAGGPESERWVSVTWRLDFGLGAGDAEILISSTIGPAGTATAPTWRWGDGSSPAACGSATYHSGARRIVVGWPTDCLHDVLWADLVEVTTSSSPCEDGRCTPTGTDSWPGGDRTMRAGPILLDTSPLVWDADPETTERLAWPSGSHGSVVTSRTRYPAWRTGGSTTDARRYPVAEYAVLARQDVFADALASAGLTSRGPLLLTPRSTLTDGVRNELRRVVEPGATVYLLGGEEALSREVEQQVRRIGYHTQRLAGADRIATAVVVARNSVERPARSFKIARAYGPPGSGASDSAAWADAVAGRLVGDANQPMLLTTTDRLDPRVRRLLVDAVQAAGSVQVIPMGGPAALSARTLDDLRAIGGVTVMDRVAGSNRFQTAVEARRSTQHRPRVLLVNGEHPHGWWQGILAGDLAGDLSAALLYVRLGDVPAATSDSISDGCHLLETAVVGTTAVVGPEVVEQVQQLNGSRC